MRFPESDPILPRASSIRCVGRKRRTDSTRPTTCSVGQVSGCQGLADTGVFFRDNGEVPLGLERGNNVSHFALLIMAATLVATPALAPAATPPAIEAARCVGAADGRARRTALATRRLRRRAHRLWLWRPLKRHLSNCSFRLIDIVAVVVADC